MNVKLVRPNKQSCKHLGFPCEADPDQLSIELSLKRVVVLYGTQRLISQRCLTEAHVVNPAFACCVSALGRFVSP
jgi:hypothetical protein